MKDKITILIPAKNEQETIADVILSSKNYSDDIIVIDGNSSDNTFQIAHNLGVRVLSEERPGKGAAIKRAIKYIKKPITVIIDADGSHEPMDINKIVEPIIKRSADLVIASRVLANSEEKNNNLDNLIRYLGGRFLSYLISVRWHIDLTDVLNGFRAIRTDLLRDLRLAENDFTYELEIIIKCIKKNISIIDVPSFEYARKGGISKLPTYKGYKFILYLLKSLF